MAAVVIKDPYLHSYESHKGEFDRQFPLLRQACIDISTWRGTWSVDLKVSTASAENISEKERQQQAEIIQNKLAELQKNIQTAVRLIEDLQGAVGYLGHDPARNSWVKDLKNKQAIIEAVYTDMLERYPAAQKAGKAFKDYLVPDPSSGLLGWLWPFPPKLTTQEPTPLNFTLVSTTQQPPTIQRQETPPPTSISASDIPAKPQPPKDPPPHKKQKEKLDSKTN